MQRMNIGVPIHVIDRETGNLFEEKVYHQKTLDWLYPEFPGFLQRIALIFLCAKKWVSCIVGWYQNSCFSKKSIRPFVDEFKVDLSESVKKIEEFVSFEDFFSRKIFPRKLDKSTLVNPVDGRLKVFSVWEEQLVDVKGRRMDLKMLLKDSKKAALYEQGVVAIFRLAPCDYHRFHALFTARVIGVHIFSGGYFSVNPLSMYRNIERVIENKRVVLDLLPEKGKICSLIFIGATNVGSIEINVKEGDYIKKGQEIGSFHFGGSMVIFCCQKNEIKIAEDLLNWEKIFPNREVLCKYGTSFANFL